MHRAMALIWTLSLLLLVACPASVEPPDGTGGDAGSLDRISLDTVLGDLNPSPDAQQDAGQPDRAQADAAIDDAQAPDAVSIPDAAGSDVVVAVDAAAPPDAATTEDAAALDVGVSGDARLDDARRDQCIDDAGCSSGTCTALPAAEGATRFCVNEPNLWRHACEDGGLSMHACCEDPDCPPVEDGGLAGRCLAFEIGYCGGAAPQPVNVCRVPDCQLDDDCGSAQACLPSGAFGHSLATCADAECRSDEDCQARAGGTCRPLATGTCDRVGGFYCTYADDPCRTDSDCVGNLYPQLCIPDEDGGTTRCVDNPPMP